LNLGDSIDGNTDEASTRRDLERVATQFDRLRVRGVPAYHVLGNHCLTLPREAVLGRLGMVASYYAVEVGPGWRLVVADTNDLSVHWPEG
jgi:hypothetical protein